MRSDQASWVREHVWTQHMRRDYENVGATSTCACEYGPTQHCSADRHRACHRAEPLPCPESYIARTTGQVVHMPAPYTHPTPSATGAHRTREAQVWLADRTCRWLCVCTCHDTLF